jgi:DNA-binding MarR family transcriptional regulator
VIGIGAAGPVTDLTGCALLLEAAMSAEREPNLSDCNCLAVRQAARYVTQLYDRHLAACGLRTSQYGILAKLKRLGPMTINELAADLVIDRTTLGRNIRPLERDGLIAITPGRTDRRVKELRLTALGDERFQETRQAWVAAQRSFETGFGPARSAELRGLLNALVDSGLVPRDEG